MKSVTIYFGTGFSSTLTAEDAEIEKVIKTILNGDTDWLTSNGPQAAQTIRVSSIVGFEHPAEPGPGASVSEPPRLGEEHKSP